MTMGIDERLPEGCECGLTFGFPDLSVESSIRRAIINPDFGVGCRSARALRCS
jgi:hypothetical protein